MIHSIISALIAVFIVLFIVNKEDNKDLKHYFLSVNKMFTKQNLIDTIYAFKTPRAWFMLIVVLLFNLIW